MEKVYQANTLKTALIMQKVATQNKKNQVVSKASASLYNLLVSNNYSRSGTKILSCNSSALEGNTLFDGVLKFAVSFNEGRLSKQAEIPVRVVKSQVILPDMAIVNKKIAAISATNSVHVQAETRAKAIKELAERNSKILQKPFVYKKEAHKNTTKDKLYTEDKYKKYIGKVEKLDYTVPKTKLQEENPNYTHTLNRNTNDKFLEHFKINKTSLPESVKLGDVLDFADKKYKVTSDDGKGNWGLDYYAVPVMEVK